MQSVRSVWPRAQDVSVSWQQKWFFLFLLIFHVFLPFKTIIIRFKMSLYSCTFCHSRHPFEDLSKGDQLCKVSWLSVMFLVIWLNRSISYKYNNIPIVRCSLNIYLYFVEVLNDFDVMNRRRLIRTYETSSSTRNYYIFLTTLGLFFTVASILLSRTVWKRTCIISHI